MTPFQRAMASWRHQTIDRPSVQPICMSFASRYAHIPFERYARDHRALAEAQMRVAEEFGIDVVSLTSDPCRECHDLGGGIVWFADEPPMPDPASPAIAEKAALARMTVPDPTTTPRMGECVRGVAYLRERVGQDVAVQGWVEGPMAQGSNLRGLNQMMEDLVDDAPFVRDLFAFIVEVEIAYLRAQVSAGADIIGMGDAAASLVGPGPYRELIWPHQKRIVDAIHQTGAKARLHICGYIDHLLPHISELGFDMVDVDALTSLSSARENLPHTPLLGNVDPVRCVRDGDPGTIERELAACQAICGTEFIVGAGCELPPDTPIENFRALTAFGR